VYTFASTDEGTPRLDPARVDGDEVELKTTDDN
jgi:hypothetical protein